MSTIVRERPAPIALTENANARIAAMMARAPEGTLGVPATARASFGVYSDESDVDRLLRGIARVKRIFG